MYDNVPPHFIRTVSTCPNHKYPGQWINRGKPKAWPTKSPDLNMLEFLKSFQNCVYATAVSAAREH
jgi:hypothetical protein